jgi:MipA family protein
MPSAKTIPNRVAAAAAVLLFASGVSPLWAANAPADATGVATPPNAFFSPSPGEGPAPRPAKTWQFNLGLGVGGEPRYPGSGQISVSPLPLVSVTYLDRYFVSTSEGLGAYIFKSENFRLGASFDVAPDTRYRGKDARLRGLPKIKTGGQAKLFAEYDLGEVEINAALRERIGHTNGLSADFGAAYRLALSPVWRIKVGPSVTYNSASINDAFFGVTPLDVKHAATYGNVIKAYRPQAGIEKVSFNIDSSYALRQNWTLLTRVDLGVLVGRDGASPIVRNRFQPAVTAIAVYAF